MEHRAQGKERGLFLVHLIQSFTLEGEGGAGGAHAESMVIDSFWEASGLAARRIREGLKSARP